MSTQEDDAPAAELEVEDPFNLAVGFEPEDEQEPTQENDQPLRNRREERPSGKRHTGKPPPIALDQMMTYFIACDRCSFFMVGYKLLVGIEALATAVADADETNWLTLPWNSQLPELISKSYGNRVDIASDYYEGCCPNCRRPFVLRTAHEEQEAVLQISY